MVGSSTLMAHLIPRLTIQVENAATDALGYILNRSTPCMQALNDLLREGEDDIRAIAYVKTQVTYEDGSRPDMAGYDETNVKRLLIEAKFYAALLEGQASGYAQQLANLGPAVLLFICPELRIPTLWEATRRQIEERWRLEPIVSPSGVRRGRLLGTELQLVLISWARLLDRMDALAGDDDVTSDIRQLQGLAQLQDAQAFLPIHSEELDPSLAQRMVWYSRLTDDVVDAHGVAKGWMQTQGLRATPQRYGYGRYFRFPGVEGHFWLGVNHERWARNGDTPLWLAVYDNPQVSMNQIERAMNVQAQDGWIPIHPRLGAEYEEVLSDVVAQLKAIAEIAGAHLTAEPSAAKD